MADPSSAPPRPCAGAKRARVDSDEEDAPYVEDEDLGAVFFRGSQVPPSQPSEDDAAPAAAGAAAAAGGGGGDNEEDHELPWDEAPSDDDEPNTSDDAGGGRPAAAAASPSAQYSQAKDALWVEVLTPQQVAAARAAGAAAEGNGGFKKCVEVAGRVVILVWSRGAFHCLDGLCYHMGAPLVKAALVDIEDTPALKCPQHGKLFRMNGQEVDRRGAVIGGWAQRTHATKITAEGALKVFLNRASTQFASDGYQQPMPVPPPPPTQQQQPTTPRRASPQANPALRLAAAAAVGPRTPTRSGYASGVASLLGTPNASAPAGGLHGAGGRPPAKRHEGPNGVATPPVRSPNKCGGGGGHAGVGLGRIFHSTAAPVSPALSRSLFGGGGGGGTGGSGLTPTPSLLDAGWREPPAPNPRRHPPVVCALQPADSQMLSLSSSATATTGGSGTTGTQGSRHTTPGSTQTTTSGSQRSRGARRVLLLDSAGEERPQPQPQPQQLPAAPASRLPIGARCDDTAAAAAALVPSVRILPRTAVPLAGATGPTPEDVPLEPSQGTPPDAGSRGRHEGRRTGGRLWHAIGSSSPCGLALSPDTALLHVSQAPAAEVLTAAEAERVAALISAAASDRQHATPTTTRVWRKVCTVHGRTVLLMYARGRFACVDGLCTAQQPADASPGPSGTPQQQPPHTLEHARIELADEVHARTAGAPPATPPRAPVLNILCEQHAKCFRSTGEEIDAATAFVLQNRAIRPHAVDVHADGTVHVTLDVGGAAYDGDAAQQARGGGGGDGGGPLSQASQPMGSQGSAYDTPLGRIAREKRRMMATRMALAD